MGVYIKGMVMPTSCTNCERCLEKCPMGLNIVKVMKKIGGENK